MAESNKDKIQKVLSEQFNKHRYIFWYDAEGTMEELVMGLDIEGVTILTLAHNAFSLKYRIVNGDQPARGFLIYSKEAEPEKENNWLLDLQMEGMKFSADMASLYATECNIPMELKERIIDEHLEFFKVARHREKLAEVVRAGMSGTEIVSRMLAVAAHTPIATYDLLTYMLADECINQKSDLQDRLEKYNLLATYWEMAEKAFGYDKARQVKDLVIVLFQDELATILGQSKLTNEAHIFMRDWRDSRQYGEMYKLWATQLETELGIMQQIQGEPIERLVRIETFPCVDKVIAKYIHKEVKHGTITTEKLESIVDERRNKLFFSVAAHTINAFLEARRLLEAIEKLATGLSIISAEEGFKLYTSELYVIDQHYRHFFREAKLAESTNLIGDITPKVQQVYTNTFLSALAAKWQPVVDAMERWSISGVYSQRTFFNTYVSPFTQKGKRLFVIISDALRYETMVELEGRIAQENRMETDLKPAMLCVQPSYTQLGMAALLPHRVLSYEKESAEVFADGVSTQGTANRTKVLQASVPKSIAIKAEDFLEVCSKDWVKDYDLVYIYSNTIDKVGDALATETNVFKATEDEMDKIVRLVKTISSSNGTNILITADHGYIYQNEELDETDFTDFKAQGGTCYIENRRFVIGRGLWDGNGAKSWKSEEVGLKAGVDIQICKGLSRIRKQGSGSRFVHGGSMPQEVAVPVLHVNVKKKTDVKQVDVDILGKQTHITQMSQSVKFYQTEETTEKTKGITLRLGFYSAESEIISDQVMLTFDSASTDSMQREQKHTFKFKNIISKLNGQVVTLRMEKQIENSDQFAPYREEEYKVSVMFEAEW
ncbi:BREX-1 system phosphatase PglZ type A [Bacteroides cellulosilyticus]|uniref:BREX-1 system phosphatase PglZ type A n=1 Tax=Bacteroides cellulosilyticus TaxID=246787 RepID=UPI001D088CA1|nr:BREX-1 system phosphatase PglZ type A [Bacteroides cellulosilyticus]MCB6594542.1 BREX-1 system phosphatase PglZ type A [Bacteroides cellulosilyticus]